MLATKIIEGREIKCIQIGKEEEKWSLFVGDMMLFRENPKEFTPPKKRSPIRTNEFRTIAE